MPPVIKIALTNTAPTPLTDTVWNTTVYPAPTAANNYTAGGNTPTVHQRLTTTAYVFKLVLAIPCLRPRPVASGHSVMPSSTNSAPTNKVVGYYDYGSRITLADTETFTVDFDPTNGVIQMTMTP